MPLNQSHIEEDKCSDNCLLIQLKSVIVMNDSVIQLITMSLTTFRTSLTHLHPTQSSSIVLMNQIEEAECNDDLCESVEVIKMKDSIEQVSLTCDWLY